MIDFREKFEGLVEELRDERQGMQAKMHAAKLDAQQGWDKVEERFEQIKGNKDEFIVKTHLAKMDMLDEWKKVERQLEQLKSRASHFTEASEDKLSETWETAKDLGDEIREGLTKIRSQF